MGFRILVHDTIIYKGKTLEAGRLIRSSRDAWPTLQAQYGDKVSFWEGWPDPETKPVQQIKKQNEKIKPAKKNEGPCSVEADSWEQMYEDAQ